MQSLRRSLALVALFAAATIAGNAQAQQVPNDFSAMVREKLPAVVAVGSKQKVAARGLAEVFPDDMPFGDLFGRGEGGLVPRQAPEQVRQALGSGFIVSADGHIVTNNHVIENATEIQVVFSDKTSVAAQLVGRDPLTDIAVLKVEPRPNTPALSWGDSDKTQPGAWTIAIGSPFGLGGTVTVGVLSARSRDIRSGPYDDFLQTDASINSGNSGGPLLNAAGEVIGVNTAIFSPVGANIGIGFAVPSRLAQSVVDQIVRTGRVERGYLGVSLQEITPAIAQALNLPGASGALVASVEQGGPGDEAGVAPGDVIVGFEGREITSPRDLSLAVANAKPGSKASLSVIRDGRKEELVAVVEQRGDGPQTAGAGGGPQQQDTRLGVRLSPVPGQMRRDIDIKDGGVLVQQVEPNTPAAQNGIRPGDIILSAGGETVKEPADLSRQWTEARRQNKPLMLRLRRDRQYVFVTIASAS